MYTNPFIDVSMYDPDIGPMVPVEFDVYRTPAEHITFANELYGGLGRRSRVPISAYTDFNVSVDISADEEGELEGALASAEDASSEE